MKNFLPRILLSVVLLAMPIKVKAMDGVEDLLPVRRSARLIILDEEDKLLLMQIKLEKPADPTAPISKPYWVTLGGGAEGDETLEQAAAREMVEETGLKDCEIGAKIWHGAWKGSSRINDETYFLVRLPGISPELDHSGLEDAERSVIKTMKWWGLAEMENSDEIFIPRNMPSMIRELLSGEILADMKIREIDLSTPKA